MKNTTNNQDTEKSKALIIYEHALLIFYVAIIIIRVLYTEGPTMQTSAVPVTSNDSLYNLYVSASLFFSFLLWLVWSLCSRRFSFRSTGIEIGLCIFSVSAVISGFFAADKRLAINNIVSLFTPVFCAILLVQIIDSYSKFKFLLVFIVILGLVCAYQCVDQMLFLNRDTVIEFERNPESTLEPLNIQPGTLQYFLFVQRLYSNNARAYFTTRNSAGSFFLLALFATFALLMGSERPVKLKVIFIILLIATFLTKSKGAITGLFFAFVLLVFYLRYGPRLKAHRKSILAAFVLLIASGAFLIAWYGQTHQTLPGGNSMLVRWQYWQASAKMFMDHFRTGVGPGNFSSYYSYYKPAAALESVTDPHNFALSILTQYGLPGLIGFLLMIFLPLWKITNSQTFVLQQPDKQEQNLIINKTAVNIILCLWFGLLLARLALFPALKSTNILVVIYVLIWYFIPPFAVFIISLRLLRKYACSESYTKDSARRRNTVAAILFCALLGFLLHNLTDYAIFEPGIYTTFWFLFAALIALNSNNKQQQRMVFTLEPYQKTTTILTALSLSFIFLNYVVVPVAKSTGKINLAQKAFSSGRLEEAHYLLDFAAHDDKLSTYALSLNARMYMKDAGIATAREEKFKLLLFAQKYLLEAVSRNSASYKNYEDLSEVRLRLSEISSPEETAGWLDLALNAAAEAVNRYEGSERMHFNLALIAERLGKTQTAIEEYKKAVEIEDKYREQFHKMYPEEVLVSRLGEEKYQFALKRITELINQGKI